MFRLVGKGRFCSGQLHAGTVTVPQRDLNRCSPVALAQIPRATVFTDGGPFRVHPHRNALNLVTHDLDEKSVFVSGAGFVSTVRGARARCLRRSATSCTSSAKQERSTDRERGVLSWAPLLLLRGVGLAATLLVVSSLLPGIYPVFASTAEKVVEATKGHFSNWIITLFLAALPIIEVRGAIPVSILVLQMDPAQAFLLSVVGNMIPVPFLLVGIEPLANWCSRRSKWLKRVFEYVFERSRNQSAGWKEHEFKAIAAFVGVPLPGTGAYSGALGCFVLGMPFWKSVLAILIGVVIASLAMTAITILGQMGWRLL